MANFVPCGRCSFFLAGYRVLFGSDELKHALEQGSDQWLELKWSEKVRHLLQDSYGSHLDVDLFYYDSRCPECQRRFVYTAANHVSGQRNDLVGMDEVLEVEEGNNGEGGSDALDTEEDLLRIELKT